MLDYSTSALCVSMVVLLKKTKQMPTYLPYFFSAWNLKHTYIFLFVPMGKCSNMNIMRYVVNVNETTTPKSNCMHARHSFYIGPIGSFNNQVNDTGSREPLVYIYSPWRRVQNVFLLYWLLNFSLYFCQKSPKNS